MGQSRPDFLPNIINRSTLNSAGLRHIASNQAGNDADLMSVNNLSDQLHWLLSVKPFVPPSVNYTTDIQTSTLPPFEDQEEDLLVSDEDLLQHDIDSETLVTSIETPSIPAAANRDAPMVRLRTEPSPSKKPRLVAQQSDPNPGRRNSNASREDGSNKTRGQSDRTSELVISIGI